MFLRIEEIYRRCVRRRHIQHRGAGYDVRGMNPPALGRDLNFRLERSAQHSRLEEIGMSPPTAKLTL
jgi:hypothetical protein